MKRESSPLFVRVKEREKQQALPLVFENEPMKKHRKKTKRVDDICLLSLFSGCGGMDIGFEGGFSCLKRSINEKLHPDWIVENKGVQVEVAETGFKTVFANDIRPDAKAVWCEYFSQNKDNVNEIYHLDSIVELVKREKKTHSGVFPKNIDVVTGGFPCQDFSLAGRRLGFDSQCSHDGTKLKPDEPSIESRGQLYMWMREVITLTQPKIFIAENVKGLTNLGDVKTIIEHDFADAADGGYIVLEAKVLHAADYGVPQSRERVIFFGFKKSALRSSVIKKFQSGKIPDELDPYPPKTHAFTVENNGFLCNPVTCAEAFVDLLEPDCDANAEQQIYSKAKYMGKHCQGQTEINLNSIGPTIRSEHHGNIEFRRLSEEHGGKHADELRMGYKERRLSIRECARIQTFPDDYKFLIPALNGNCSVKSTNAYIVIGNAVPCVLAYNIAMNLRSKWKLWFK